MRVIVVLIISMVTTMLLVSFSKANSNNSLPDEPRSLTAADVDNFFAYKEAAPKIMSSIVVSSLLQVQLSLERWGVDHRLPNGAPSYPKSMTDLVGDQYVQSGFYANPVTAHNRQDRDAQEQPLGQWSAGNFSYQPHIVDGVAIGYLLLGYAVEPDDGKDINDDGVADGVLIVLMSGGVNEEDWYHAVLMEAFVPNKSIGEIITDLGFRQ